MKRLYLLIIILLTVAVGMHAVPAQPGLWRTISLGDGTKVEVQLVGDEYLHFWQARDGRVFDDNDRLLTNADMQQRRIQSNKRRMSAIKRHSPSRASRLAPRTSLPIRNYTGEKRGLIILVEFQDTKFRTGHNQALYDRIANEPGFTNKDGFRGSVHDYFYDQSRGAFDLTFDVLGPIQMPQGYAYYGKNGGPYDFDLHPGEMVITACNAIDDLVDFSDYDWDYDGEVDQVMVIYAGRGEASGGTDNTIWPHEWCLTEAEGAPLELDGVKIDTYACSCEIGYTNNIDGIGTTCHEFSHCLGIPDMYDIDYGGNFGLGSYSLMSGGSYNGNSFTPAGYTSFERMCCGWLTPIELTSDMEVTGMKALTDGGEAYILYNDAWPDEFYLLENRQQISWDEGLSEHGMIILHVDYDETVWYYNLVNTCADYSEKEGYGPGAVNDHERCTMFHADGYNSGYWASPYPYYDNNSLTPESNPAATLYHPNSQDEMFMSIPILDITEDGDGTISFNTGSATGIHPSPLTPPFGSAASPGEESSTLNSQPSTLNSYYTLDGRPIVGEPTQKGIYIHRGKKVVRLNK